MGIAPNVKKAAFLVYPMFCNWETALAIAALKMFGKDIDVIAIDDKPVRSEEGLVVFDKDWIFRAI